MGGGGGYIYRRMQWLHYSTLILLGVKAFFRGDIWVEHSSCFFLSHSFVCLFVSQVLLVCLVPGAGVGVCVCVGGITGEQENVCLQCPLLVPFKFTSIELVQWCKRGKEA